MLGPVRAEPCPDGTAHSAAGRRGGRPVKGSGIDSATGGKVVVVRAGSIDIVIIPFHVTKEKPPTREQTTDKRVHVHLYEYGVSFFKMGNCREGEMK